MWKYLMAWLVMLVVSVANGAARDLLYGKTMTELAAHQVSTAVGILLLGAVMWGYFQLFPAASAREALLAGFGWTVLTVAFEFLFFHYLGGHAWAELLANYDVTKGRVWVLVLLWIATAPTLIYVLRGR